MDNNSASPLKNTSLYVGLVVIAIIVLAALGTWRILQNRTRTQEAVPTPSPESFETLKTPSPSPVLGEAAPDNQPATGPELSYYLTIFGSLTAGLYLARYKKRA